MKASKGVCLRLAKQGYFAVAPELCAQQGDVTWMRRRPRPAAHRRSSSTRMRATLSKHHRAAADDGWRRMRDRFKKLCAP